eukprot:TRINITY_DN7331_c0_g1_i1.p1 TRINITY_DN7331_c0_g1~~TRINITY_DN7331_c0_g1_i1.p1  ORF type:complete len:755 (+),score=229.52 TRINITY_DN7331_c0_g1_i1:122-2386(+)
MSLVKSFSSVFKTQKGQRSRAFTSPPLSKDDYSDAASSDDSGSQWNLTPQNFTPDEPDTELSSGAAVFGGKQGTFFVYNTAAYFELPKSTSYVSIPYEEILLVHKQATKLWEITTARQVHLVSMKSSLFRIFEKAFSAYIAKHPPLHSAIRREDSKMLSVLLAGDKEEHTIPVDLFALDDAQQIPLFAAVRSRNPKTVKLFLDYYARNELDINQRDDYGWTLLFILFHYNKGTLAEEQILKMILDHEGLDVNARATDGNTALHYFCKKFGSYSCQELGELLIKKGVNVNTKNRSNETPLHYAILNHHVMMLMVDMLIKHGADVNVLTERGDTALHYAVRTQRNDLIKTLLVGGADVSIVSKVDDKTAYDIAMESHLYKVAETIKRAQDLRKWLQASNLEELSGILVKEELYLDILREAEISILNKSINSLNLSAGSQILLQKAIHTLKEAKNPAPNPLASPSPATPGGSRSMVKQEKAKLSLKEKLKQAKMKTPQEPSLSSEQTKVLHDSLTQIFENANSQKWIIDDRDLEITKKLGGGNSGKVFKGLWTDRKSDDRRKVAVKVLKTDQRSLEELKKELTVMSVLDNPHIIKFFGACIEPKVCIVMEYCSRGSLYDIMTDTEIPVGWEIFFKFSVEILRGLNYLHTFTPSIVHRDMKSLNVMIDDDWNIKLIDFGLARLVNETNLATLMNMVGTIGWTAPELMDGKKKYNEKCDIYSTAIILWEMVTRVIRGTINFQVEIQVEKLENVDGQENT